MEKYGVVFYVFILVLSVFSYILSATRNKKHKLPPGSMGWPYIGETLQLYSQDPNIFFSDRHTRFRSFDHSHVNNVFVWSSPLFHFFYLWWFYRYGEIFKSRMLGYPCVMLASPEAARFVLVTHANLFKPTYPKSKEDLIGPAALFFHQGDHHLRLRKVVQRCLSPEAIRNFVADIEDIAVSALESWADGEVINTFREMKKVRRLSLLQFFGFFFFSSLLIFHFSLNQFSFEVGILAIFGHLEDHHKEELKRNYCIVEKGYNSFPTKFPGSPYSNALKVKHWNSLVFNGRN